MVGCKEDGRVAPRDRRVERWWVGRVVMERSE